MGRIVIEKGEIEKTEMKELCSMSFSIKQLFFWDKYIIDFMFICSATSCYTVKDCVYDNSGKCMDPLSNELVYLPFLPH